MWRSALALPAFGGRGEVALEQPQNGQQREGKAGADQQQPILAGAAGNADGGDDPDIRRGR
jgi:hypothetical protein